MTTPLMKQQILEMIEAEQAGKGVSNNHGTSGSFNNYGSGEKSDISMTSPLMKRILEMIDAEKAGKGFSNNYGTSGSFNNHGSGPQDFSRAKINSGANTGDRNRYDTSNHFNGRTINNSGTFRGNGNGGFVEGGFDASTRNYY